MKVDLVVVNGKLVTPEGIIRAGIAIENGKIVSIARDSNLPSADKTIDAKGNFVMPGVVDPHCHSGSERPYEEDIKFESPSAAAGGITTWGTMVRPTRMGPLEAHKERPTAEDVVSYKEVFDLAKSILEKYAMVDYVFNFTIMTDQHAYEIPYYAKEFGVTSYKFYLHYTPAFFKLYDHAQYVGHVVPLDDGTIFLGFEQISKLGYPGIAFCHCESAELIRVMTDRIKKEGRDDLAAWEETRPPLAEVEHIRKAAYLAKITNCPLYIVHVTSEDGLNEVQRCRAEGPKITAEVSPHHLTFTKYDEKGALLKYIPPVRDKRHVQALWQGLRTGLIDCVGSDHVAVIKEVREKCLKLGAKTPLSLAKAGSPSVETMLPIMLNGVNEGKISFERLVEVCCRNPAMKALGLYPKKGTFCVGSDADLVVVDMNKKVKVTSDILHSSSGFTAFEGMELKGWPTLTMLRGNVIMKDGDVVAKPGIGKYIYRKVRPPA